MKIINLSYQKFEIRNPIQWIKGFRLFYGIWEEINKRHEVQYLHFSEQQTAINGNGIQHRFQKLSQFSLSFPFSLHRSLRKLKPDVVMVHGLMYPWQVWLLSMQLPEVKIWMQHHAEPPVQHPIKKWFQKLADKRISGYLFTGKELAKPWLEAGSIADSSKVYELMEVSSVFQKKPKDDCRKDLGLKAKRNILWVGHLNENKNPLLAVAAFIKLREQVESDVDLHLIFQSEELLTELHQLLNDHPAEVSGIHLIGKVPHSEMETWYSAVDFILSTSNYEGSGTALCEAMSCGCVPVVSDIPSFRFMLQNSGYLVNKGSEAAFTEILKTALSADYEADSTKVMKRYDEALSFQAIAKQLDELISSVA